MFCPNCGTSISDQATACPSCGHPMRKPKMKSKTLVVFFCALAGPLGLHRFYLGDVAIGFAFILLSIMLAVMAPELIMLMWIIAVLDTVVLLFRGSDYYRRP